MNINMCPADLDRVNREWANKFSLFLVTPQAKWSENYAKRVTQMASRLSRQLTGHRNGGFTSPKGGEA